MGIIILPFLLVTLIVGVIALVKLIKLLKLKSIRLKELFLGLLTTLILFGLISLTYIIQGKAWGLSPVFRIPIFMVFIPFIIHLATEKNKKPKIEYISKLLLISVVITVILGIVFKDVLFELINYLGIKKYY